MSASLSVVVAGGEAASVPAGKANQVLCRDDSNLAPECQAIQGKGGKALSILLLIALVLFLVAGIGNAVAREAAPIWASLVCFGLALLTAHNIWPHT